MRSFLLTAVLAAATSTSTAVQAADWPQWRGPNRDGRIDSPVEEWPQSLTSKWRATVGEGHSSPVVSGGRVFLHSRENDREVVRCLELETGKSVWLKHYDAPYEMHSAARGHGKGPKSTPAVADGRLFTFGVSGILSCFEAESGRVLWRKDFSKTYKRTSPLYGSAASPLVYKDVVVVHIGGNDKGAFTAFDVKTGETKWEWDKDGPAYTSPIVVKADGVEQLVTQTQRSILSVDPANGKELWRLPFKTSHDQNSITPLVYDDLLIVSGYGAGTQAYRIQNTTAGWSPKKVWSTQEISEYMSTPVVHGNLMFGLSHKSSGQLFCAAPKTGKVYWTNRGRTAKNAGLISTSNAILVQKDDGEMLVLEPTSERMNVVARYRTSNNPVWAHPVLVGRTLLVKDKTSLLCFEVK